MDIEILNVENVIASCEELLDYSAQVSTHSDSLQQTLNTVNNRWESNGQDKESYVLELEKQIENLNTMEHAISSLANSVLTYAENIKATSQKSMSN